MDDADSKDSFLDASLSMGADASAPAGHDGDAPQSSESASDEQPESPPTPPRQHSPLEWDSTALPAPADPLLTLRATLERWLECAVQSSDPPDGVAVELLAEAEAESSSQPAPLRDLYELYSALTVLSGEVRLQGRAFKVLSDGMAPLGGVEPTLAALAESQAQVLHGVEQLTEEQMRVRLSPLPDAAALLDVLLDLYDRLQRTVQTLDEGTGQLPQEGKGMRRPIWFGWRKRLRNMEQSVMALREGQRLMLSRLEAALMQWNIQATAETGDMFDPLTMTAVEVEQVAEEVAGSVLEVYRCGYMIDDRVIRTAQVKVAK